MRDDAGRLGIASIPGALLAECRCARATYMAVDSAEETITDKETGRLHDAAGTSVSHAV